MALLLRYTGNVLRLFDKKALVPGLLLFVIVSISFNSHAQKTLRLSLPDDRDEITATGIHDLVTSSSVSRGYPLPKVDERSLPEWVLRYMHWHRDMRAQFPGTKLFTDPNAPKLLIRTCTMRCGGLHDRLGKLPWDLYLANQTNRILLLHWCLPAPLEQFLLPHYIDWSVPNGTKGYHNGSDACMSTVGSLPDLFRGFRSTLPGSEFWETQVDISLERARNGEFKDEKILRHQILGSAEHLQLRLEALNESDMIDWTPSFGKIFWLFFRPVPLLQRELDSVYNDLGLVPNQYSSVHCRVRHPKGFPRGTSIKGKILQPGGADRVGLLWDGQSREFAVDVATRALRCAHTILKHPDESIYFYSDSEDLARYMAHQLKDAEFVANKASIFATNSTDSAALKIVNQTRILSRNITTENLHIDRQSGNDAKSYFPSFVDLLVASRSRCIVAGVGGYAVFAAKLSGTSCLLLYQSEDWPDKESHSKQCKLEEMDK